MPIEFGNRPGTEWAEELYGYLWRVKVQDWIMTKWQREIKARENVMADMFNNDGPKAPAPLTVTTMVLDTIKSSWDNCLADAVKAAAAPELKKRAEAIALAHDVHSRLRREFSKMKGDLPAIFDETGTEISPARWSRDHLETKAKLLKKLADGDKAFAKAQGGDFNDLYNWNNSNNKPGKPEKSGGGGDPEGNG
jgi:hypothetical protein